MTMTMDRRPQCGRHETAQRGGGQQWHGGKGLLRLLLRLLLQSVLPVPISFLFVLGGGGGY